MSVGHSAMVSRAFFDHRGGAWVESGLVLFRSEIRKFESIFEKKSAPRCSSDLLTFTLHFLDHLMVGFRRFGSFHL